MVFICLYHVSDCDMFVYDFDMFVILPILCVSFTAQELAEEMAKDEAVRRAVNSAKID